MSDLRKIIPSTWMPLYLREQRDFSGIARAKPLPWVGREERVTTQPVTARPPQIWGKECHARLAGHQTLPELIFVKPSFECTAKYPDNQIHLFEYTDLVEPMALDEAYLDVTVNKKHGHRHRHCKKRSDKNL